MAAGNGFVESGRVTGPGGSVSSFWDLVLWAAGNRPDEVLVEDDDGRQLSSVQFAALAERVAAGLRNRGLQPGHTVSWQLPTTIEAALLMAALNRLGITQNPIIPAFRDREVGFILDQCRPDWFVVAATGEGDDHGLHHTHDVEVLGLQLLAASGRDFRLPDDDPTVLPPPPGSWAECRWIYYSSGTTGVPKGARHSDRSVIASSNGVVDGLGMRQDDVYPIAWPFAHIGGVSMLSAALRTGGTLVLFDSFDPAATPERMAEHTPTVLGSATPFFNAYIAAQRRHGAEPLFPRLRACVGGGAPTPEHVSREVAATLGVPGVASAWGLTEFPVATSETPDDTTIGTTVGCPAAGVEVRVVDSELWLRGPQQFLGYVDASLDAEVLDPDGWFRTGDLGRIGADGRVHIEGRSKDVIIRNAENVSAAEVEGVIAAHPAVRDVSVVGIADSRTGERVCAVVVLRQGRELTLGDMFAHCEAQGLARFKCPERIEIVAELPRNAMGKVLKEQLRSHLLGP